MSFTFPLILAIGITADSIIIGETSLKKYKFIFVLTALVHACLFFIGLKLGFHFTQIMGQWDHWITMVVFFVLGINSIKHSIDDKQLVILNQFKKVILVIFALSLDALAVAATTSNFFKNEILVISLVFISSLLFCYLGRYIKKHYLKFSHKTFYLAEGFLFFGLGISIVINHIKGGY